MNDKTDYGFGIKVTTHCEGAWSFGSCISHSFGETYPYTYNAPQHDWKCGYPDITRGKEE